ncbi:MAG: CPBP family intramembrane metalloprotease [Hyphomonas sp.]|nr:CPBP family intramembrane metalloprotease [Hyphomonas sp.]
MPIFSPDALSLVDILLACLLVIGLPLEGELARGGVLAKVRAGAPGARIRLYRQTIFMLWGLTLPLLVVWAVAGRDWAALGFGIAGGWTALAGWALAALACGFFLLQYFNVRLSPAARAEARKVFSKMDGALCFLPATEKERGLYRLTGLTAGITEEILFRGYLIWAFGLIVPVWAAAAASLALFVFLHRYQGRAGLIQVAGIGIVLTLVVLLSGSTWPAIALHIVTDIANGETAWQATQPEDTMA